MIFLDIESYGPEPLKDCGVYKYAQTADILLISYCIDEEPVETLDLAEWNYGSPPDELVNSSLFEALKTPHEVCAHNSNFERTMFEAVYGPECFPGIYLWHDTMILALTLGLPGALGQLCDALGMGEDTAKMKDGAKLINRFCKPAPSNHKADRYTKETHPDEWQRFVEYCERDCELVRTIWNLLPKHNYNRERENWLLDQVINDRGFPVDVDLCHAAIELTDKAMETFNAELDELTDGVVTAVSQVGRMKKFLKSELAA